MPRYIDADEIEFKPVEVVFEGKSYTSSEFFAHKKAIDKIPTVDVEPVRHGHWIWLENSSIVWIAKCSNCGFKAILATKCGNYCPACGVKMDEKEE